MFKIKINESPEQDKRVNDHRKKIAKTGNRELPTTEETRICQEIIKIIKPKKLFKILIPYSDNIKFNNTRDGRKNDMFFDMIKAFTVFKYKQRKPDDEGYLIADIEDFCDAAEFYNEYGVTHYLELTAREIELCKIVMENNLITIRRLVKITNLSPSGIDKILKGIDKKLDGLGVFKRFPENIGGGGMVYQYSLRGFDLEKYSSGERVSMNSEKIDYYWTMKESKKNQRIIRSFK